MKTWTAALSHIGLATLSAATGVAFFDPATPAGLANIPVQVGIQTALMALQLFVARRNSASDPKGVPLAEVSPGKFVSWQWTK